MDSNRCDSPRCPCRVTRPSDAADKAARLIGVDPESAVSLLAMLSAHGWKLEKQQ